MNNEKRKMVFSRLFKKKRVAPAPTAVDDLHAKQKPIDYSIKKNQVAPINTSPLSETKKLGDHVDTPRNDKREDSYSESSSISPFREPFIDNEYKENAYYFYLVGSAEIYANHFKTGDYHQNNKSFSPFTNITKSVDSNTSHHIPRENYHPNEIQAFEAAREQYTNHAITIFKLELPDSTLQLLARQDSDLPSLVSKLSVFDHVVSMKSLHTRRDNEDTLNTAPVYHKMIENDSVVFTNDETPKKFRP